MKRVSLLINLIPDERDRAVCHTAAGNTGEFVS